MTTAESARCLNADQIINIHTNYLATYGRLPSNETVEGLLFLAAEAVEGEGMLILGDTKR